MSTLFEQILDIEESELDDEVPCSALLEDDSPCPRPAVHHVSAQCSKCLALILRFYCDSCYQHLLRCNVYHTIEGARDGGVLVIVK